MKWNKNNTYLILLISGIYSWFYGTMGSWYPILQNIEGVIDIKLLDDIMQMCLGGAQKK